MDFDFSKLEQEEKDNLENPLENEPLPKKKGKARKQVEYEEPIDDLHFNGVRKKKKKDATIKIKKTQLMKLIQGQNQLPFIEQDFKVKREKRLSPYQKFMQENKATINKYKSKFGGSFIKAGSQLWKQYGKAKYVKK